MSCRIFFSSPANDIYEPSFQTQDHYSGNTEVFILHKFSNKTYQPLSCTAIVSEWQTMCLFAVRRLIKCTATTGHLRIIVICTFYSQGTTTRGGRRSRVRTQLGGGALVESISLPDPEAFSDFLGCFGGEAEGKSFITKAALTSLSDFLKGLDWFQCQTS